MNWKIIADKGREEPIKYLEQHSDINIETKQITVGDYAICCNNNIKVIIERKTWKDLADTIKNPQRRSNHLKLLELRNKINCTIVYIIEGITHPSETRKFNRVPYKNLRAYLDHLIFKDNCHIVHTESIEHTALRIIQLCHSYMTIKSQTDNTADENQDTESYVVNTDIQEVNEIDEINNTDLIQKHTQQTLDIVYEKLWLCISGVTCISYPIISKLYTLKQLINGVSSESIAILKYPSNISIGKSRADQIINSIKLKSTHIKMLSSINGITKQTATNILSQKTMQELINMDKKEISELTKTTKIVNGCIKTITIKSLGDKIYDVINFNLNH